MPATMTHQLFAQTIIEEHPFFKDIHKDMFKVMMLATQGPDHFSFTGCTLLKKKKMLNVSNILGVIFTMKILQNLSQLLKHAFSKRSRSRHLKTLCSWCTYALCIRSTCPCVCFFFNFWI